MPRNPFSSLRLAAPPRFHRNGVAGEGFYAVTFRYRELGGPKPAWRLLAAVLPAPPDWADPWDEAKVFVFDPADRNVGYNGPWFAPWLVARCREASDSGAAFRLDSDPAPPVVRKLIPANPAAGSP